MEEAVAAVLVEAVGRRQALLALLAHPAHQRRGRRPLRRRRRVRRRVQLAEEPAAE